jgi:hypothetical protein
MVNPKVTAQVKNESSPRDFLLVRMQKAMAMEARLA